MGELLLAWMDLETTGLSPEDDQILEMALVLTDADLAIRSSHVWLARTHEGFEQMVAGLPVRVRELHERSGLLERLAEEWSGLPTALQLDGEVVSRLPSADEGRVLLAGSGTDRFDRRFLERWMPRTSGRLHYRGVDVSPVRLMASLWAPGLEAELEECQPMLPHRALPDVMAALEQARTVRRFLARG